MTSQRTRDRLVRRLRDGGIASEAVLAQIGRIPRHIFVDEALAHRAYEDTALPIGLNQTISQPFIVALMTELLCNVPRRNVLEIGTGCGYQTAVLAGLCEKIWTIERIGELSRRAITRLKLLGIRNYRAKTGDGYAGWSSNAPYDGIIVTAAPPQVPQALLEQLQVGGRLVAPIGSGGGQMLTVIDRTPEGFTEARREPVQFVPMLKGLE